jgi:integrase/PHD/YefM family antitoxin component YafN of YafNO toxin-antitoxin module
MPIQTVNAPQFIGLEEFLLNTQELIKQAGSSPLLVLHDNKPAFYVVPVKSWNAIWNQMAQDLPAPRLLLDGEHRLPPAPAPNPRLGLTADPLSDQRSFEKKNKFTALAEKLLDLEWDRVARGELSAASVGIQKNRLDAHVLPFFRYIAVTQVTHVDLEGFVSRLTQHHLSTTTISQYLVLVRKLLKLAVRQDLLKEVPEFPHVKVATHARAMVTLLEYFKLGRTALRLSRAQVEAPEIKSSEGKRARFWVAPRNKWLAPDMFWAIRFMVNSFVRPGDLRQLKHKHVTIVRGQSVYLRMNLPETKKHDKPMVTMSSAVHVYEAILRHRKEFGHGGDDDYVFLPEEKDRNYALAVLGFWFKWVVREAGLPTTDDWGRPRTLYCLRHTAIMFRLLYGQGIDMLTLARNARTSVQMIEQFYASSLDGEMNVAMIQSRRPGKLRKI